MNFHPLVARRDRFVNTVFMLTPEQWQRVFALVKASQLCAENQRASFLAQSSTDDEILQAAQSLLVAQQKMGSFLERVADASVLITQADELISTERGMFSFTPSTETQSSDPKKHLTLPPGATLGRYVVVNLLG